MSAVAEHGPIPGRLSSEYGSPWWHPYWSLNTRVLLNGEPLGFVHEARAGDELGWAEISVVRNVDAGGDVRLLMETDIDGNVQNFAGHYAAQFALRPVELIM